MSRAAPPKSDPASTAKVPSDLVQSGSAQADLAPSDLAQSGSAHRPTAALFACMRNEGLLILEWLAYHRVIGFGPVIIASNDCTDGSEHLLDRLADAGALVHLRNPVPPGEAPQGSGMRLVLDWLESEQGAPDWVAHLDSDEFLNIGHGAGKIDDLLAVAGHGDVIALPWRMFGDNGHARWPGEVLAAFTACEGPLSTATVKFKSMFRHADFAHASDHMPTGARKSDPLVLSVAGQPLSNDAVLHNPRAKYRPLAQAIRPGAVVNHYAVASHDLFQLKNDRGDGQAKASYKYYLGSQWFDYANRNEHEDRSILRHRDATRTEMERLRALPGVAQAEAACIDDFHARRARVLTPEQIRAWSKPAYLAAHDRPAGLDHPAPPLTALPLTGPVSAGPVSAGPTLTGLSPAI